MLSRASTSRSCRLRFCPPEPIPDAGGDSVTYQGESVKTGGGAPNVPDDLGELTGTLSVLFDRYAPKTRF